MKPNSAFGRTMTGHGYVNHAACIKSGSAFATEIISKRGFMSKKIDGVFQ